MSTGTGATARRSRQVQVLLGLLIGVACIWYAVQGTDAAGFRASLRTAQPAWFAAAAALLLCSYLLRAVRWAQILGNDDGPNSLLVLAWATGLGYALNSVLPARAGDIARSAGAARYEHRSTAKLLASTVVERVVDALVLATALLVIVPTVDGLPSWLIATARVVGGVSFLLLVILFVTARRVRRRPTPATQGASVGAVRRNLASFGNGLLLIHSWRHAMRVFVATVAVWALDTCIALALAGAFDIELSPAEGLALLAAFGLGSAAPSTPGFVGVYQAIAVALLVPLGATREAAIFLATSLQVVTLLTSTALAVGGALLIARRDRSPLGAVLSRERAAR